MEHSRSAHPEKRWLLPAIVIAATTHGLAFVNSGNTTSPDAAEYLALGKSLAISRQLMLPTGERAKRMPLYPALIAGTYLITGDKYFERTVLAVQCLLAIGSTLCIAWTARILADARAGVIAGLTAALYAPFIYLQSLCLTETLVIFLLSLAVLTYVRHVASRRESITPSLFATAMLLALVALARANAAILMVPFVADGVARASQWRTRLARAVILVLPTLLALADWGLRNWRQIGAFTLSTTGGLNFYLGHNPHYAEDPGLATADYEVFDRLRSDGHNESEADRLLFEQGLSFAVANPSMTLVNTLRKLIVYHRPTITDSAPSILLIALVCLVFAGRRQRSSTVTPARGLVYAIAWTGLVVTLLFWITLFCTTMRPWTSPAHVVPLGLYALLLMKTTPPVRGLFIGLYIAELSIALAFIPLARLRWTVDGLLIIALAVGLSNLCNWLAQGSARERT